MSLKNYRLFNVKRIVALMLVIVFSFQSMVINTYADCVNSFSQN